MKFKGKKERESEREEIFINLLWRKSVWKVFYRNLKNSERENAQIQKLVQKMDPKLDQNILFNM